MPMVVSDPRLPDDPIVLANAAFLELGGYTAAEVIGHNCRFMQGPGTDPRAIAKIREALALEQEITIELLNYRKDGSSFWNELFISPVHSDAGDLIYFFASSKDVSKRKQARDLEIEEHRLLLEVDHRAKNALALVQGFVRLSSRDNAEAYAESVQSRVDALARAHTMLALHGWRGVPFATLVQSEAELYGTRRVAADGPEVSIGSQQVQPLALFLHEMLSNASKHGGLAYERGAVRISWDVERDRLLSIAWRESGGPVPAKDRPRHLGTTLINQIVHRQLRGQAVFEFRDTGLEATFRLPLSLPT
jgi:PAS domain S-box-containing protein